VAKGEAGEDDEPLSRSTEAVEEATASRIGFVGALRRRPFGWGVSWPFGHLEFDATDLKMWGMGTELNVSKGDVRAIALRPGLLAGVAYVVYKDGRRSELYFAGPRRSTLRHALRQRGWPTEG
jgi:hypothetical protein